MEEMVLNGDKGNKEKEEFERNEPTNPLDNPIEKFKEQQKKSPLDLTQYEEIDEDIIDHEEEGGE